MKEMHVGLLVDRMASVISKLKGLRKPRTDSQVSQPDMVIGEPTAVKHNVHVGFNPETNEFNGLPAAWENWLQMSNIR